MLFEVLLSDNVVAIVATSKPAYRTEVARFVASTDLVPIGTPAKTLRVRKVATLERGKPRPSRLARNWNGISHAR